MNLVLTVFNITAPVFILASIGFFWVRLGFEYPVSFVTRLAMTFAVPALIFGALMQSQVTPSALASVATAAIAAYALITVAACALVRLGKLDAATFIPPLMIGNTGNLGLPLAFFAFGDLGLDYAVVIFAVSSIFAFTLGIWLVSGRGRLLSVLKEPTVIATLLGALFLWRGWETPIALTNAIELVGQLAIPLMLITLGVAVSKLRPQAMTISTGLVLAKLALGLCCGWVISHAFGLDPVASAVLVLQLSMPVAVTSYLLAQKYGADAAAVAGLVVVSTLLSLITIPLVLAFLI